MSFPLPGIKENSSDALPVACVGAEQAESSLSASTSDPEAGPAQAGLVAPIQAGHSDTRGSGQQAVSLGAREALALAEAMCPPSQLVIISTGARQDREESASIGMAFTGRGVSKMPHVRAETGAKADVCDAPPEVVDMGVQTDASLAACKLDTDPETRCSVSNCHVKGQADTHTAQPAESAPADCVSYDGMASSDVDAEESAEHSSKAGGVASGAGKQLYMSYGHCVSEQAEMQNIGSCDPVQCTSGRVESALTERKQMQQARPALLDLVTACGVHDSLKELIRADRNCLAYKKDQILLSVVEQIWDLLTADST